MLSIFNNQPEDITIAYGDNSIIIRGWESYVITNMTQGIIMVKHSGFCSCTSTKVDKMLDKVAKSSVLIVDVTVFIERIGENATLEIKNGAYEHSTGDFGYFYFDISGNNCEIVINECEVVNKKDVLRTQRLIRANEAFELPPFSCVSSWLKYNKIKKMCSKEEVMKFLFSKYCDKA